MPQYVFNLYEAKTALSRLVDRAALGEEIVIAKAGVPLAKLTALAGPKVVRKPGGWKGKVRVGKDFDEPLPEPVQAILEGRSCAKE